MSTPTPPTPGSKRQRMAALRRLLAECFPRCFLPEGDAAPRRPLKQGIFRDLCIALPEASRETLRQVLRDYTHGAAYRTVMVAGALRVDLAGWPAGTVTVDEAAFHARRNARDLAIAAARTGAAETREAA
jgi:ProP effector